MGCNMPTRATILQAKILTKCMLKIRIGAMQMEKKAMNMDGKIYRSVVYKFNNQIETTKYQSCLLPKKEEKEKKIYNSI